MQSERDFIVLDGVYVFSFICCHCLGESILTGSTQHGHPRRPRAHNLPPGFLHGGAVPRHIKRLRRLRQRSRVRRQARHSPGLIVKLRFYT